jgi:hypothetical protein
MMFFILSIIENTLTSREIKVVYIGGIKSVYDKLNWDLYCYGDFSMKISGTSKWGDSLHGDLDKGES